MMKRKRDKQREKPPSGFQCQDICKMIMGQVERDPRVDWSLCENRVIQHCVAIGAGQTWLGLQADDYRVEMTASFGDATLEQLPVPFTAAELQRVISDYNSRSLAMQNASLSVQHDKDRTRVAILSTPGRSAYVHLGAAFHLFYDHIMKEPRLRLRSHPACFKLLEDACIQQIGEDVNKSILLYIRCAHDLVMQLKRTRKQDSKTEYRCKRARKLQEGENKDNYYIKDARGVVHEFLLDPGVKEELVNKGYRYHLSKEYAKRSYGDSSDIAWNQKRTISMAEDVLLHFHVPQHSNNIFCVDHINRNPKDNRVDNLRWATVKENNANRSLPGSKKTTQNDIPVAPITIQTALFT